MATFVYPALSFNTTGLATEAKQDTMITELQAINTELDAHTTELQAVNSELNTQTTELQAINSELDTQTTTLASIDTKVATQTTLAALEAKDFASQTTLAAVLADTTSLDAKDFATQTTLAALNAKVTAVDTTGKATEAKQDNIIDALDLDVVDQIDATPVLDTSSTNIPGSASLPLEVVASTAARVRKITSVEDVGEFIGLYIGAATSEVLLAVLPLGGGDLEVDIPASTRISLRAMGASAISTGSIALNLQG